MLKPAKVIVDSFILILTGLCGYFLFASSNLSTYKPLLFPAGFSLFVFCFVLMIADIRKLSKRKPGKFSRAIYEFALLNEQSKAIRTWRVQGSSAVIIGKSTMNIHADIDLRETAFASLIDPEHALLNYTEKGWFLEDNDSRNGVSILKKDGQRHFISRTEPCLVEKGDVIYIADTRLLAR